MNRNKKILAGAAVFGALAIAAGAGAFTASSSVPAATTLGYGATAVTGVTVSTMNYVLNAAGTQVTSVHYVVAAPIPGASHATIRITDTTALVYDSGWIPCDTTTIATEITCDTTTRASVVPGGAAAPVTVANVDKLELVVQ